MPVYGRLRLIRKSTTGILIFRFLSRLVAILFIYPLLRAAAAAAAPPIAVHSAQQKQQQTVYLVSTAVVQQYWYHLPVPTICTM